MHSDDTIAAISTPSGRGGIGVIRLSGPAALAITESFFVPQTATSLQPNVARFGKLTDPANRETIDEAVVLYFKAPHSYTGDDVVEISCHGSPIILSRVLKIAIERGARVAEPGEFTFRAFANRRIDLSQAQAVRDLIDAQTDFQARVATRQLDGRLSRKLQPLKDSLVEIIVQIESSIEFVEDDISTETINTLHARLNSIIAELTEIAASFSFGRLLREGFDLAIVGRPNVGKSSVFNRLIGAERAIVTEFPGTTRDALYETTSISGVPVRLIDTAGVRETNDVVENIGIDRTRSAIADADIVLLVIDGSERLQPEDIQLLDSVSDLSRIVAVNKSDLPNQLENSGVQEGSGVDWRQGLVRISALTGSGFEALKATIFHQLAGDHAAERDDIMLTDARQHAALSDAVHTLTEAGELLSIREFEEIVLLKLRSALQSLGEVTGETLTEDILNQIFSTFCIGK